MYPKHFWVWVWYLVFNQTQTQTQIHKNYHTHTKPNYHTHTKTKPKYPKIFIPTQKKNPIPKKFWAFLYFLNNFAYLTKNITKKTFKMFINKDKS
jgi:hypothetical protein